MEVDLQLFFYVTLKFGGVPVAGWE